MAKSSKNKYCSVKHLSDKELLKKELLKYWQSPKLTKAQIAKQKKEEKRRAKKITMTVGELEDKLEEARYEGLYY